ncbi:MAG: acyl-CoA dehydrogenase family protein [Pseudomonadota bacterium]
MSSLPHASDLSHHIAPDCRGENFYRLDADFPQLLANYLPPALFTHIEPHLDRLGQVAGGRLDELAHTADHHPPVLTPRDRFGRDKGGVDYHPAYREMERLAFGEFGIHAASHRPGVLDWPEAFPPIVKYALQYLFTQSEFGLMCPVSLTDTGAFLLARYGSESLKSRYLPRMLSQDMDLLYRGAQFMTERPAGSDVGQVELRAESAGDHWRLHGEKWFCSSADADVSLLLARTPNAQSGTAGLSLFLLPKQWDDRRNAYRVVRLKDKLGSRSMASGEIVFEGALAYLVGEEGNGFKQMMDQVNLSRLSHGIRAAAMMRRCVNEALAAARGRITFGKAIVHHPLMQRQLLKLIVPCEQALSMSLWGAHLLGAGLDGDPEANTILRILTPLTKYRACRDNITVATGAMEVRGGNGYIEDWVNARLVRDAHLGVLWEGTSNINALDAINRAVLKVRAHEQLGATLEARLNEASDLPGQFRGRLNHALSRAAMLAERIAESGDEMEARRASGGLYHAVTAALCALESVSGKEPNPRRLWLSYLILRHRLGARDPLALPDEDKAEVLATRQLLGLERPSWPEAIQAVQGA